MDNDRETVPGTTSVRADEYRPPTLTVIGDIGEVVMGVPGSTWDQQGYADPIFEFQSDGEEV